MKIIIVYPVLGRTTEELARFCKEGCEASGHTVSLFGYSNFRLSSRLPVLYGVENFLADRKLGRLIRRFSPSLVLVIKGDRIRTDSIRRLRQRYAIPVVNYWIDDPARITMSTAISPAYDHFFTNSPDAVSRHRDAGCAAPHWLTFGISPTVHRKIELTGLERRTYGSDICFSGTISEKRLHILESLADFDIRIWAPRCITTATGATESIQRPLPASSPLYDKFSDRRVWWDEMVKVYNASRIVLNIHDPQTCPIMRDFEAPGCGAFLITDSAQKLAELFIPGEEIVCFESVDDLRAKVQYYLCHADERGAIARNGYEKAHALHRYQHRMDELIATIACRTHNG